MKRLKMLGLFLIVGALLSGCGKSEEINVNFSHEATDTVDYKGKDFISIAKGEDMELLLSPDTAVIRWKNNKTGEYVDNRLSPEDISNTTALSDVVANYFNGKDSKKYNSTASMDSYTYGVKAEAVSYENIPNGVRFFYKLGSSDVTYKMFPAYISDERMQTLIMDKLDSKQLKAVKAQYRLTNSGVWARKTNKDNPLSGLAAPQLYEIFYNVCGYTYEELEFDCTEGNTLDELPEDQTVEIVMDYYLDNNDLMVRIPTINLMSGKDYPLESLDVLPYFMASNSKDGYIFVPDGSGALIYLDNDRLQEFPYTSRYFGGDILQDIAEYNPSPTYMPLPVYGIKADSHAVLGIIEEGAEIAKLTTYLSGYYSGIDYARAGLRFYLRESQTLSNYVGVTNNYTLSRISTDYYHDDIVLRYCFLTGEDANYSGMAKAYQKRLVDQGKIAVNEADTDAPLFVDLLGEVDKTLYFAGIPYKSSIALTSFKDALNIITDISDSNISNIKVQYEGMVNGGLNQRAVEKIKLSKKLGGKKDFKALLDFAGTHGASIYPSIKLETACTAKNLSKNERSYTLAGELAKLPYYDFVFNKKNQREFEPDRFIIAPTYINDYTNKFLSSYKALGLNTLASTDFMTFMSGDYRNSKHVSITTGKPEYEKALQNLSKDNSLMLSNPSVLSYKDVEYLVNIPTHNSGTKILDAYVPFTQMVLDGCIICAGEYVNRDNATLDETLMKSIEARSALNFRFISVDTEELVNTSTDDVFFAEYRLWKNDIATYYEKYNAFYQLVKDAAIKEHKIIDRNNDLRTVTYTNGVKIFFNYSDEGVTIENTYVEPLSYVISKGGRS